ncbi:hypothetical protein [Elizabethkingia anophelis]|uniref:hypothetical protein n=1 Tax=Elizabethkingia anophelis TaxID=1117645 RepID=UPI00301E5373
MKTLQKYSFPQIENKYLSDRLLQIIEKYSIMYIFYRMASVATGSKVVLYICTLNKEEAEKLQRQKWVSKLLTENILVYFTYHFRLDYGFFTGNPFDWYYGATATVLYKNKDATLPIENQKLFFKNFKEHKDRYYQPHKVLSSQAQQLLSQKSIPSAYMVYISLFNHHFDYLKELYTGSTFTTENLHEKIQYLSAHIPEIKIPFANRKCNEYYLLTALNRAKKAVKKNDDTLIDPELINAIIETEFELNQMVIKRFREFKAIIKSDFQKPPLLLTTADTSSNHVSQENEQLSMVVSIITSRIIPEEIYLFHKQEIVYCNYYNGKSRGKPTTLYYLLLVGTNISNEELLNIGQSVVSKSDNQCAVVLIGHGRGWIQKNVSRHQSFFKNFMCNENKIYTSDESHSQIQWKYPFQPKYSDLEIYYRSALKNVQQYFILRKHSHENNHEFTFNLFAGTFTRLIRCYIYSSLIYLPNYLTSFSLWKLCVYSAPEFEKLEILFEKISIKFYFMIDYYLKFHHNETHLSLEQLLAMDEILTFLSEKLTQKVNENTQIEISI